MLSVFFDQFRRDRFSENFIKNSIFIVLSEFFIRFKSLSFFFIFNHFKVLCFLHLYMSPKYQVSRKPSALQIISNTTFPFKSNSCACEVISTKSLNRLKYFPLIKLLEHKTHTVNPILFLGSRSYFILLTRTNKFYQKLG